MFRPTPQETETIHAVHFPERMPAEFHGKLAGLLAPMDRSFAGAMRDLPPRDSDGGPTSWPAALRGLTDWLQGELDRFYEERGLDLATIFNRYTVNINRTTKPHRDKLNTPGTLAALTVFHYGELTAAPYEFPEAENGGLRVDVAPRDLLILNLHELHGVEKPVLLSEGARKISVVAYQR